MSMLLVWCGLCDGLFLKGGVVVDLNRAISNKHSLHWHGEHVSVLRRELGVRVRVRVRDLAA